MTNHVTVHRLPRLRSHIFERLFDASAPPQMSLVIDVFLSKIGASRPWATCGRAVRGTPFERVIYAVLKVWLH